MIAGPGEYVTGELVELLAPARVFDIDAPRPDDEDVDVARGIPVAARCRAENRQVDGRDLPRPDLIAQTALELRSHVGKKLNRRRGEVFAVERVQVRPARLTGSY